MTLYIVKNRMLGTTAVVDADGSETAARVHAHGATVRELTAVAPLAPSGATSLYVTFSDGELAATPIVTAIPAHAGRADEMTNVWEAVGTAGAAYVVVEVYTLTPGADRPTFQGWRGVSRHGARTAVYHGDRELCIARVKLDAESGVFVRPDALTLHPESGPMVDRAPRLPRDRKREQTFPTGAVARDNHGSYSVDVPTDDGTGAASRHPSRVRSRALHFARSVWGGSAHVTDRISGAAFRRDADGREVRVQGFQVVIVDPEHAYRFAAGGGMYAELPLP